MIEKDNHRQVLVTGGGGFLGKAIVTALAQRGDSVTSFSRSRHPELDNLGVGQIQGDLVDEAAVSEACRGMETVFHVAAKAGVWGPLDTYYRPNVIGTQNVVKACRRHGVPQMVYTSSPSVVFDGSDMEGIDESVPYPDKFHAAYPRTKAQAEKLVVAAADARLRTIALRPHLIWGPQDPHLTPRIIARARHLRIIGKGNNRVDTIYVDNAADAHIQASDRLALDAAISGNVYFISNDEPIVLWQMINRILDAAGLPPVRRSISKGAAVAAGVILEGVHRLFNLPGEPRMTRFVAQEMATAHWFDISAAKRDFGYSPTVSLAEGFEHLANWLDTKSQGTGLKENS